MLYGYASTQRFAADAASTRGGQILVADASCSPGGSKLVTRTIRSSRRCWSDGSAPTTGPRSTTGYRRTRRFKVGRIGIMANGLALGLLAYTLLTVVTLPRV